MAEFINPPSKFETSGEKRVAEALKKKLNADCYFWYNVPIGEKRLHPDFVVLIPNKGLLALEVKDWKPTTLKGLSPNNATIETPHGRKEVTHPIEQARNSIFPIINTLERDPLLKQSVKSKHGGKICFPYTYGAVFTNISRQQFHKVIPQEKRQELLPDRYLLCKNDIVPSASKESFEELLIEMFEYQYDPPLTDKQIDRIRWHIFPDIRIQTDMFFDTEQVTDNKKAMLENAVAEPKPMNYTLPKLPESKTSTTNMKVMDTRQEKLARNLGEGHRVIHGVAGSGKTIILYYRCRQLAELLKKPILVLCFNVSLAQKLQTSIAQRNIKNVEVNNFNAWCASQLRKHTIKTIGGKDEIWVRQVESVIQAVDKGKIQAGQYGAILIDEGHDFEPDWLKLIVKMVDPVTNALLLLYDDAQSIYKKESSLNFSLASVGIKAQGRTTILKTNYRNTKEILQFAYQLAKNYFPKSENEDIPVIAPETSGETGKKPVVQQFNDPRKEIQNCLKILQRLSKEGKRWEDIAIISPIAKTLENLAEELDKQELPYQILISRKQKRGYQPHANKITLISTASSKGLEFNTAIILNSSFTYNKNDQDDKEETEDYLVKSIRHLYVAMTRAQTLLFISYWKKNELAELIHNARNKQ